MTVTFLGTGTSQGIPIIGSQHPVCLSNNPKDKRLRVSVLLEWEGACYVIDCGPDFRQQMLREGVQRIDGVLFTHEHNDHVAGLDDIRPFYFRQGDITCYAYKRVFDALKQRFAYVFETINKYPSAPTIKEVEIEKDHPFTISGKKVIPVEAMHADLSVLGFRIDNFAYMTDVKIIEDSEMQKLMGLDVLVLNALRIKPHESHLNLEEALAIVNILKPKKTFFTHISHLLGFHDEVEANLPEGVHLAYDTLKITI
ncbi:MAG TPA: MBL fold metallo-hydrolase [Flavobacteriaceae bacterium]|nr:MBL fold metallo-hydrolase [Flavobacteriaceae bacterium]MCB9213417.1 MBL fold metallo-hydrolase [Alteromonas sp.]HPF10311.1 MBL fold metallo-hydrolase [Flavobacteriaceae bacterium]HQU20757.1 MBL fold metallo-hydrolase [Flavobacteriaceae bacterium]HQU64825.1 MBL fold metallo-hydrolase [Flavobacteriaceae bacterium]